LWSEYNPQSKGSQLMEKHVRRLIHSVVTASMATAFVAVATTADAQYVEHWRLNTTDAPFIASNLARDVGYNPVTDSLLVPHRDGGPNVTRIASSSGTILSPNLDTTGITNVATFDLNGIHVSDLGGDAYSVYVCGLSVNVNTAPIRIHRWHSDGSSGVVTEDTLGAPTIVYSNRTASGAEPSPVGPPLPDTTKPSPRVGDFMGGWTDGSVTRLYLSVGTSVGTDADLVYVITVDEATGTVTSVDDVTTVGQTGQQTWGANADAAGNIYNMTNGGTGYYDPSGNLLHMFDSSVIPSNASRPSPMQNGGRSFFGYIHPADTATGIRVLEVTDGVDDDAEEFLATPSLGATSNNAVRGAGVFLDVNERFVGLVTNNAIVSFSDENPLLITLADLSAKVNEPSGTVTISWETASEIDNAGFNVFRADSNGDASSKVNAILIPSAGDGASYSLVDEQTLAPGETRGYILQDVDANGTTTNHGPVSVTRGGSASSVGEWNRF